MNEKETIRLSFEAAKEEQKMNNNQQILIYAILGTHNTKTVTVGLPSALYLDNNI